MSETWVSDHGVSIIHIVFDIKKSIYQKLHILQLRVAGIFIAEDPAFHVFGFDDKYAEAGNDDMIDPGGAVVGRDDSHSIASTVSHFVAGFIPSFPNSLDIRLQIRKPSKTPTLRPLSGFYTFRESCPPRWRSLRQGAFSAGQQTWPETHSTPYRHQ